MLVSYPTTSGNQRRRHRPKTHHQKWLAARFDSPTLNDDSTDHVRHSGSPYHQAIGKKLYEQRLIGPACLVSRSPWPCSARALAKNAPMRWPSSAASESCRLHRRVLHTSITSPHLPLSLSGSRKYHVGSSFSPAVKPGTIPFFLIFFLATAHHAPIWLSAARITCS